MDFGALHCKPQNPLCESCPFANSCVAFEKKLIKVLPLKDKKIKVKKRYFNFLVIQTIDDKTVLLERKGKGIWQGLYQFPLIETNQNISGEALISKENLSVYFLKRPQFHYSIKKRLSINYHTNTFILNFGL